MLFNFTMRSSLKEQTLSFLDMLSWRYPRGCAVVSWLYKSNASERRHRAGRTCSSSYQYIFSSELRFLFLFFFQTGISNWCMKDFLKKHPLWSLEKRERCSHRLFHIWFFRWFLKPKCPRYFGNSKKHIK